MCLSPSLVAWSLNFRLCTSHFALNHRSRIRNQDGTAIRWRKVGWRIRSNSEFPTQISKETMNLVHISNVFGILGAKKQKTCNFVSFSPAIFGTIKVWNPHGSVITEIVSHLTLQNPGFMSLFLPKNKDSTPTVSTVSQHTIPGQPSREKSWFSSSWYDPPILIGLLVPCAGRNKNTNLPGFQSGNGLVTKFLGVFFLRGSTN